MIIPNIWKNKKCSKPPTRRSIFTINRIPRLSLILGWTWCLPAKNMCCLLYFEGQGCSLFANRKRSTRSTSNQIHLMRVKHSKAVLVGGLRKIWKSVGMIIPFPTEWTVIKILFQTTNQIIIYKSPTISNITMGNHHVQWVNPRTKWRFLAGKTIFYQIILLFQLLIID